jgi:tetratricopeptide (TPR) repeat protein
LSYISALRQGYDETSRWLQESLSRARASEKMEGLWLVNYYDYLLGRTEKSLAGYLALRKTAETNGAGYLLAVVDWITGFIYADLGRFDAARKAFLADFEYWKQGDPASQDDYRSRLAFQLGWVDLKEGRLEGVRDRLEEISGLLPELAPGDLRAATFRYQLLDAEAALAGDPSEKALDVAGRLRLLSFFGMNTPDLASYNTPFLRDVLARAYWRAGSLDQAVAEYRNLMTIDPKNRVRYLIHPLYHYRLGRVLEEKGDRAGAAVEYKKFLEYWKDADPSHPELADARGRLAAL